MTQTVYDTSLDIAIGITSHCSFCGSEHHVQACRDLLAFLNCNDVLSPHILAQLLWQHRQAAYAFLGSLPTALLAQQADMYAEWLHYYAPNAITANDLLFAWLPHLHGEPVRHAPRYELLAA